MRAALGAESEDGDALAVEHADIGCLAWKLVTGEPPFSTNKDTIWGIAYQIGSSAYVKGKPDAFLNEVAELDRVSAADIKRVAAKYLTRKNLSLVLLPPGGGRPRSARAKKGGAR